MSHVQEHCAPPPFRDFGRKAESPGRMWVCECGKVYSLQHGGIPAVYENGQRSLEWIDTGLRATTKQAWFLNPPDPTKPVPS